MNKYELTPIYNNVKSYYRKAIVKEFDGYKVLQSYDTDVCYIYNGQFHRTWGGYSATTAIHIHEFRRQNEFIGICKKEWELLPVEQCPNH